MSAYSDHKPLHRRGRLATALLALSVAVVGPAAARQTPAAQAPASWVAYAATATKALEIWLASDAPDAAALHQRLADQPDAGSSATTASLWVDRRGIVRRVRFELPDMATNIPLSFVGRMIGPPPRRMRQPLRVAIDIKRGD